MLPVQPDTCRHVPAATELGLTLDHYPVRGPVRAVGLGEFLSKCRHGSFKITGLDSGSSQILDRFARLDDGVVSFFQSRIQRCDELR